MPEAGMNGRWSAFLFRDRRHLCSLGPKRVRRHPRSAFRKRKYLRHELFDAIRQSLKLEPEHFSLGHTLEEHKENNNSMKA